MSNASSFSSFSMFLCLFAQFSSANGHLITTPPFDLWLNLESESSAISLFLAGDLVFT